jgi:hypothetical protein
MVHVFNPPLIEHSLRTLFHFPAVAELADVRSHTSRSDGIVSSQENDISLLETSSWEAAIRHQS